MALIDTTTFKSIADRAAAQYGYLVAAFASVNLSGDGFYYQLANATGNVDVQIPLVGSYHDFVDLAWSLANSVKNGTPLRNVISYMNDHFSRMSETGGWDGYCTSQDVRVDDYTNQIHYLTRNQYMLSNNVFSESDDTLGTAEVAAGPVIDFTDGTNYGNGANTNRASGSNFAATQLKAVVDVCGIGVTLATNLYLTLTVKNKLNELTTIAVELPAGTALDAEVDIGTTVSRFLDVTGIDFTGVGNRGTVGDIITIHNKKERTIAL